MGQFWKNHGTKILGALVTLIGAMGDCVELFKSVDPDPKHLAIYSLIVAFGSAVIKRGYTNSATLAVSASQNQKGRVSVVLLLFIAGQALVACAALGLPMTLSLDEKIAAGYAAQTAVVSAAATAVNAGTLTSAGGQEVLTMAKSSRSLLDIARAEEESNPAGASAELTLATTALTALQKYVNTHLPAKGT